jgi:hypothetical protein
MFNPLLERAIEQADLEPTLIKSTLTIIAFGTRNYCCLILSEPLLI